MGTTGTFQGPGQVDVRKELIDSTLKGFADRAYKMKQAVSLVDSGAWTNFFWRGNPNTLDAGRSTNRKGVPRGAEFPQATTTMKKIRSDMEKYGLRDSIPFEDILAGEVDVRDRTLKKIAEGVVEGVDNQIFTGLSTDADIHTVTTSIFGGTHNSGGAWDQASAAILDDLERCQQLFGENNYDVGNIFVFINHRDKRSITKFLTDKGAQYPSVSEKMMNSANGQIGRLGNFTFIVSPVVTASQALVLVPKVCGTWKSLLPLTTDVENEPLKDVRITAAEIGVLQVTDPKAIAIIKGTQI